MARHARPRSAQPSGRLSKLHHVENFIFGDGQITLGRIGPIACAAVAADGSNMLAALVRRKGETLNELLARLDDAIDQAVNEDIFVDEING